MPVQPASVAVKFAVAAIFLGGVGFGVVAALSQPQVRAKAKPTGVEVAKAEPTKPEPTPTPATKPDPKPTPATKPESKKPDPPKTEPTRTAAKPEPKPEPPKTEVVTFQKVQGLLRAACTTCHGDPKIEARVDLRTVASMMMKKGLLVPGDPDASDLWGAIDAGTMPPPDAKTKLTEAEKKLIKAWIAGGAK